VVAEAGAGAEVVVEEVVVVVVEEEEAEEAIWLRLRHCARR
jgi:hypothetical protein